MEAVLGVLRTLAVDVADSTTQAGENWQSLPMQNGGSLSRATAKADTTNKSDVGFTSEVVTTKTWSISGEGFDSPHSIALRHLAQKWESTTTIDVKTHVKAILETGEEYEGWASLDSLELTFPTNEPAGYSLSFTGRGQLNRR